jgi:hypothetical protein
MSLRLLLLLLLRLRLLLLLMLTLMLLKLLLLMMLLASYVTVLRVEHPADSPDYCQRRSDAPWPSGTDWSPVMRKLSAPLVTAILQLSSGMESPFRCVFCLIPHFAHQSLNQSLAETCWKMCETGAYPSFKSLSVRIDLPPRRTENIQVDLVRSLNPIEMVNDL